MAGVTATARQKKAQRSAKIRRIKAAAHLPQATTPLRRNAAQMTAKKKRSRC